MLFRRCLIQSILIDSREPEKCIFFCPTGDAESLTHCQLLLKRGHVRDAAASARGGCGWGRVAGSGLHRSGCEVALCPSCPLATMGELRCAALRCAVARFSLSRSISGNPRASARARDFSRPAALGKAKNCREALHRPPKGLAKFRFTHSGRSQDIQTTVRFYGRLNSTNYSHTNVA